MIRYRSKPLGNENHCRDMYEQQAASMAAGFNDRRQLQMVYQLYGEFLDRSGKREPGTGTFVFAAEMKHDAIRRARALRAQGMTVTVVDSSGRQVDEPPHALAGSRGSTDGTQRAA